MDGLKERFGVTQIGRPTSSNEYRPFSCTVSHQWEKNRRVLRRKLTVIGVSTWQRSKRGYWSRQASGGSTFAGPSGPSGNDIGRPRDARRARNYGMFGDEIILEIAKLEREAHIRVRVRMAAEQLGECFADRRDDSSAMRGADRRAT